MLFCFCALPICSFWPWLQEKQLMMNFKSFCGPPLIELHTKSILQYICASYCSWSHWTERLPCLLSSPSLGCWMLPFRIQTVYFVKQNRMAFFSDWNHSLRALTLRERSAATVGEDAEIDLMKQPPLDNSQFLLGIWQFLDLHWCVLYQFSRQVLYLNTIS